MSEDSQHGQTEIPKLDRFHEIELERLMEGIIALHHLRMQAGVFFGTVNLGALAVAVTTQKAMVLFFAGVLLWMLIAVDMVSRISVAAYYYRCLKLQERFAPGDDGFLTMLPGSSVTYARDIANLSDLDGQTLVLGYLPLRSLRVQSNLGFWLPLAASLLEIAAGLVFWLVLGWPLI
jgi:hypothetical protein